MKVHLQYPWRFSDSPYYKYLTTNPPEGIEYLNAHQSTGVITSSKKFAKNLKLKSILRGILRFTKLPYITKTKRGNYDLIHCCHCLSINKFPWVVDVEHYWNFASSGEISYSDIGKKRIKNFLKKPNCKKILAWSHDCKDTIVEAMKDKEIEEKIEVVYPAIPLPKLNKKKKNVITLLFVARYFELKGGLDALEVFERLCQGYDNVRGVIISDVPEEIKLKYNGHDKIKIFDLMPQEKVFKIMEQADIFVYPGYSDTFGFALLEAMSYGLPIVTADGFAKRDIVKSGITGWIVGNNDGLLFATDMLIRRPSLRRFMAINARKEIAFGKFSIEHRNEQLKEIYEST
jgi:glycosyltransferase involved in cell wall biosynthesis